MVRKTQALMVETIPSAGCSVGEPMVWPHTAGHTLNDRSFRSDVVARIAIWSNSPQARWIWQRYSKLLKTVFESI